MTDDNTPDASELPARFYSRFNLRAVAFTTVGFWSVIGAAVAAFFGDWFAFAWALVALALSVVLVRDNLNE